jgi:hypothetical protein
VEDDHADFRKGPHAINKLPGALAPWDIIHEIITLGLIRAAARTVYCPLALIAAL